MLLSGLGNHFSDEDVKEIIRIADTDGDGEIDFKEFILWATKKPKDHDDPATKNTLFKIQRIKKFQQTKIQKQ